MPVDRKLLGWRAWYEGDVVYTGSRADGDFEAQWAAVPDDGCLYIKAYYADGASFTYGEAFPVTNYHKQFRGSLYYMAPGPLGWDDPVIGANEHDTMAEVLTRYPGAVVKSGKWQTHTEDQRIIDLVSAATEPP